RRPARWAPSGSNGRLDRPSVGCCQGPPRARRSVSRDWPLRSPAKDAAALAATSPLSAAERGLQVLQEPVHAAPDPEAPFLPESDHLLWYSSALAPRALGAERVERPPRRLQPRLLRSHHAPPLRRAQNTRAFALH